MGFGPGRMGKKGFYGKVGDDFDATQSLCLFWMKSSIFFGVIGGSDFSIFAIASSIFDSLSLTWLISLFCSSSCRCKAFVDSSNSARVAISSRTFSALIYLASFGVG